MASKKETVIEIDSDDDVGHPISDIIQFTGSQYHGDICIQHSILASAMVSQLHKRAGAKILSFDPEFLVGILEMMVNVRKPLFGIVIEFDNQNDTNHTESVSKALPEKINLRLKKNKKGMATSLVDLFFALNCIL